jgi:hypothetical protein
VRELAVRVRPAMQGAISPRATRRPTSTLHLAKTVAANLSRARVDGDAVSIIPERLYFKQKSRRHMDWNIVLVVDVSGSMEPSVIYSAMMAAILSAVPWIGVRFLAFSTEIIDLSEHVSDPLALLLEVQVGGGTHIAKALRYAKSLVQAAAHDRDRRQRFRRGLLGRRARRRSACARRSGRDVPRARGARRSRRAALRGADREQDAAAACRSRR